MSDNSIINETLISRDNLELYKNETDKKIRNYVGGKIDEINDSIGTLTTEINQNKTDISNIKNDISQLFDITGGGETVSGSSAYTLENAVDYPVMGINLYGKSTQDGMPTPDAPIDIVSVGDGGSVGVTACGKNLLKPTLQTTTQYGVTCTNNGDGTYTLNGTSSCHGNYFIIGYVNLFANQRYKLVGCQNGSWSTYSVRIDTGIYADLGNGIIYKATEDMRLPILIYINDTNTIMNNVIIKPMLTTDINATYDDFEPYIGTTAAITSALPLCGIPVSSSGNYTDSNGQQWICDELVRYADGSGKVVKHTVKIDSYNGETITTPYISTTGELTEDATVIYQLVEPTEIELTAAEMSALSQLQTFSGVTNIFNDGGTEMSVKYCTNGVLSEYVFPVVSGLQKQINDLNAALLSLGSNV